MPSKCIRAASTDDDFSLVVINSERNVRIGMFETPLLLPRHRLLVVSDDAHQTLERRLHESSASWMYAPDLDRGDACWLA